MLIGGKDCSANQKQSQDQTSRACTHANTYLCRVLTPASLPTIYLVLIGIGGIAVAIGTLEILERQTKAIEDTVVLTQRPRIVVRNLYFTETKASHGYVAVNGIEAGSDCSGQFYIANSGGSEAHIQEVVCKVWVDHEDGPLKAKRPYEGETGEQGNKSLTPGQSLTWLFSRSGQLQPNTTNKLLADRAYLYVLGWIGYTDNLGIYRRMAFCRRYNPQLDRFRPVDDPDYEYSE
ncbi:MAG: hypothetical protein ACLQMT_09805 [Candidatus Acidiferrales bacterium]